MHSIKTAIGLMSGTSMDGIDAALIKTDGERHLEVIGHLAIPFEPEFRALLKQGLEAASTIIVQGERPGNLGDIERDLTLRHADIVGKLLLKYNLVPQDIDVIGFHGQTMLHRPDKGFSIQIGDGHLLARNTGIDVIYDMRANDLAHGGEGAPLVPIYHAALAANMADGFDFPVAFINIGGISNLTLVKCTNIRQPLDLYAFDCGPGNSLIDQWMETMASVAFDAGGKTALGGQVNDSIVAKFLAHPFFLRSEAGSLDWRDFAPLEKDVVSLQDGAATLSYVTIAAILHSFRFLPSQPKSLIISGGGAKNGAIMGFLKQLAAEKGIMVFTAEEFGLSSDFIEAEAWAYLAVRASYKLPLTFPETTGCSAPVTGGILAKKTI